MTTEAMNGVEAAARALVGVRFRPHGRDRAGGVDCVGLVALALRAGGYAGPVPSGYGLRGGDGGRIAAMLAAGGLTPVACAAAGDVLVVVTAPGAPHLGIADGAGGIVHADAGLARVAERPGPLPWPVEACWRLGEGAWRR